MLYDITTKSKKVFLANYIFEEHLQQRLFIITLVCDPILAHMFIAETGECWYAEIDILQHL